MPLVVGLVAVGVALALAVAGLAGEAARDARAQSIADVIALKGAFAERREGSGCAVAGEAAAANGAHLIGCSADADGDVTVTVELDAGLLGVRAVSRAGPAFAP